MERGLRPNARTDSGATALMFAAALGSSRIVQRLLDAGADPSLSDLNGNTALSLAQTNNHPEVAAILEAALQQPLQKKTRT